MGGVHLAQRTRLVGIHHAVLLPAAHADNLVTDGKLRAFRLDHFAGRAAAHDLTERLRLRITLGVVHAAAHIRVQAHEVMADQHLAVGQRRRFTAVELEVAGDGFARGAVIEKDLLILWHGSLLVRYEIKSCSRPLYGGWSTIWLIKMGWPG